jgi:hypothetical protein
MKKLQCEYTSEFSSKYTEKNTKNIIEKKQKLCGAFCPPPKVRTISAFQKANQIPVWIPVRCKTAETQNRGKTIFTFFLTTIFYNLSIGID